jgi:uncharacterized repeat protein (TIGR03803 family)
MTTKEKVAFLPMQARQAIRVVCLLMLTGICGAAQTFTLLHAFTGGAGGALPVAGVSVDRAGNLYGTTFYGGGDGGDGLAYSLKNRNNAWVFSPLYNFSLGRGSFPSARSVIAPDGTLYGTTQSGGSQSCEILGCGVLYRLRPPSTICRSTNCYWSETLPWEFVLQGGQGVSPGYGDLLFDHAGNIYGTTVSDGSNAAGTVYKLTHSGGNWTYNTLYLFSGGGEGKYPESGVIMDAAGNLYGTTLNGGVLGSNCGSYGCGTVYELSPSGSGWTEKILYSFQNLNDGADPIAGLWLDSAGNLYGAATRGGVNGGGTIFKLAPSGNGNWTFSVLYSFTQSGTGFCDYVSGPTGALVMDTAGDLYGNTCTNGAYGYGAIFKLTPSNGGWAYTSLHDFTDGDDGAWPVGGVSITPDGKLFGTASGGGSGQYGTVWEIAP